MWFNLAAARFRFLAKWRLKCRGVADSLEEAGEHLFTFLRSRCPPCSGLRIHDALRLGAIGYDAVKHPVLCRIERRPAPRPPLLPGRKRAQGKGGRPFLARLPFLRFVRVGRF